MVSLNHPTRKIFKLKKGLKIALVVSEYNREITTTLQKSCTQELVRQGVSLRDIMVTPVPGAFELPWACQKISRTKNISAIIALGVIVRGETPHFEYLASQCARGIMDVSLASPVPVIFGVLTTHNLKQAKDRISGGKCGDKGSEFAQAALRMIAQ